jgi:AmiR/NasT family two-component response regulator
MYNQANSKAITTKEFAYITDSLKNEDLLTKLCVQGAVESQSQSLKQTLAQLAQERLQNYSQLMNTLQQQSGMTH